MCLSSRPPAYYLTGQAVSQDPGVDPAMQRGRSIWIPAFEPVSEVVFCHSEGGTTEESRL